MQLLCVHAFVTQLLGPCAPRKCVIRFNFSTPHSPGSISSHMATRCLLLMTSGRENQVPTCCCKIPARCFLSFQSSLFYSP
ncbi:hypothetical protein GQ54DRAFT_41641 [Martensiomyces pterosporus]|nr:hypothetical protein GQ54DRAFT_41641 [Martensiomyces pterosporus]